MPDKIKIDVYIHVVKYENAEVGRSLVRPLHPSTILASHLQDGIYLLLGGIDSYCIILIIRARSYDFVWQIIGIHFHLDKYTLLQTFSQIPRQHNI